MKELRLVLSAIAIVIASAGVYADRMFITIFYRSTVDITLDPLIGAHCDVIITGDQPPCADGIKQCLVDVLVFVNGQTFTKTYRVSKRVDLGPCTIAPMP